MAPLQNLLADVGENNNSIVSSNPVDDGEMCIDRPADISNVADEDTLDLFDHSDSHSSADDLSEKVQST